MDASAAFAQSAAPKSHVIRALTQAEAFRPTLCG